MDEIYISRIEKDTKKLAKHLSKNLKPKMILTLKGDLGAGKTTFTKYLLKFLGLKEMVSSPTFTIVKQYNIKDKIVSHMDLYRITNEEELIELGFEEIINNSYLSIIEWPDIAKSYLDSNILEINISFDDDGNRIFQFRGGEQC